MGDNAIAQFSRHCLIFLCAVYNSPEFNIETPNSPEVVSLELHL
jgi:hypothetical protein